jgi:hypothetical protein
MRYEIGCSAYSPEHQGKPWIAVVIGWIVPTRPALRWGYCHQPMAGSASILTVDCTPGSLIRSGYRDYTSGESVCRWWLACDDGQLEAIDAATAHRIWAYTHTASPQADSCTRPTTLTFYPRSCPA